MTSSKAATASDEAAGGLEDPGIRRVQRKTLGSLAVAQVVGAIGIGVTPSVGVLLAEQVTQSEVWAGLARTGSTLGAAVAALPLAALALRHGRRRALALGWTIAAAGAALLVVAAQTQNLLALVVGLTVTGVGTAAQLQARFAATDLALPAHRGRALSTVVWVGALGSVLGPNLGTPGAWLAHRLGLAELGGAFIFAAVALLAAGVVTFARLRPDPLLTAAALPAAETAASVETQTSDATSGGEPAQPAAPAVRHRFAGVREVVTLCRTNPPTALALLAIVTAQVLMVTLMTMAPVHMAAHGGSLTIVGISISLHIVGMYGLAPVAGALSDRLGARTGICVGAVLFAASFAVAFAGLDSMTWVTVSLVLLGLGWSFMSVAGAASLTDGVPEVRRPRLQGFADTASNITAALGAFVGGPVMAVVGYDGLALVAAAAMAPLCVVLITGARTRHEP
ncbi:MFS transporter [Isoptericola sp. NPDC019693]|uniref:MFS transporter n=1 Tax=Isoptericola sp. NPDC019693 TaxID=3364009 RepID=UPI0037AE630D